MRAARGTHVEAQFNRPARGLAGAGLYTRILGAGDSALEVPSTTPSPALDRFGPRIEWAAVAGLVRRQPRALIACLIVRRSETCYHEVTGPNWA